MKDPKKVMEKVGENSAMGNFGRITMLADLPPKNVLVAYIKEAMKLNEADTPPPSPMRRGRKTVASVRTPAYFLAALKTNRKAIRAYESFPPGQKREYVNWLKEAKSQETRNRRLAQAVEWIAEGKYRNWKYMRKEVGGNKGEVRGQKSEVRSQGSGRRTAGRAS
jgi:uncharacterized protein YdeI (YjbR/CyaY-like superfamily)